MFWSADTYIASPLISSYGRRWDSTREECTDPYRRAVSLPALDLSGELLVDGWSRLDSRHATQRLSLLRDNTLNTLLTSGRLIATQLS